MPAAKALSHTVLFTLKDRSEEAKQRLIDDCKRYLSSHPGTLFFAAGSLADDIQWSISDRDFDVALHLVFKNKAAHDQYAKAERHQKFSEETQDTWKKVRVFDSYLDAASHD